MTAIEKGDRILSCAAVVALTGLSRTTIWRLYTQDLFPRPIRLSPGRVGWSENAVLGRLSEMAADSLAAKSKP